MPVYEFKCEEKGDIRELVMNFQDLEAMDGGWHEYDQETGELHRYRRIYNAPAIRFNGSGFYSTGG